VFSNAEVIELSWSHKEDPHAIFEGSSRLGIGPCPRDLVHGQSKPRARDLGIPLDGTPGRYNAFDLPPSIVPALERIFRPEKNGENRWGQLLSDFLIYIKHTPQAAAIHSLQAAPFLGLQSAGSG
jgi:hypothetical protein